MSGPLKVDEEARCDRCGGFYPLDLGERRLCEECYRLCGSCCPEFGADDLWPREGEPDQGPLTGVVAGAVPAPGGRRRP